MNVSLTPQHEDLIQWMVESGLYNSPDEVVDKALQLLEEYKQKLAELRAGIQVAVDQADKGQLTPASEVFDRLERRNARRAR